MAEEKGFFEGLYDDAVDFVEEWTGYEIEQKKEELYGTKTTQQTSYPETPRAGIDWQMWGVVVGGLGVALAVYKLAK